VLGEGTGHGRKRVKQQTENWQYILKREWMKAAFADAVSFSDV